MSEIRVLYRNSDGIEQEHNPSADSVEMLSFKTENKELTDEKLSHLIDGAESENEHIHDIRYGTEYAGAINPGVTATIFQGPLADFKSSEVSVELNFADFSKSKSFQMNIVKTGSGLKDNLYAILGLMNIEVVAGVAGPDILLTIKNNESSIINYVVKRKNFF